MPISIHPLTKADIPRCAAIEHIAYAKHPLNIVLFPGTNTTGLLEYRIKELEKAVDEDHAARFFKAVDSELSGDEAIIAWARWQVCADGFPERPPKVVNTPGINAEAYMAVARAQDEVVNRLIAGKACIYLFYLLTDPEHQRRGAGTLLVQVMLEQARELGLPVFLVSSEEGHRVYEKAGFQDLEGTTVDMRPFGSDQPHVTTTMLWDTPQN